MLDFQENPVLAILAVVLGTGIFGASIWVVLPRKSSPFRYGVLGGLGICAAFQIVVGMVPLFLWVGMAFIGFSLLGAFVALALCPFLIFYGMNKIFEATLLEIFGIMIVNTAFSIGLGFFLA